MKESSHLLSTGFRECRAALQQTPVVSLQRRRTEEIIFPSEKPLHISHLCNDLFFLK